MPITTLVIDDEPDLLELYRMTFRRSPFELVGTASDGEAGIAAARELKPELVVVDLSMPRVDGLEVVMGLREEHPEMRVVVASGFAAQQMEAVCRLLGAVDYIEKGLRPKEMVARLEAAMSKDVPKYSKPDPAELASIRGRMRQLI